VVLAAGASTRLGEPKQLVRLGGETLLERTVRVAREAGCEPVVVVLGASAAMIQEECRLDEVCVVMNEDWASGMGGSIGAGVRALGDVDGCVVMTCDMPAVTASHLRRLIEGGGAGEVVASSYAGRQGVPAYFPVSAFVELKALRGDVGARGMLQGGKFVELMDGELDVDVVEDLERVRELLGR
jgi:molybdenum cofactor cytidylyltransferase